jgi:hypothetical protein
MMVMQQKSNVLGKEVAEKIQQLLHYFVMGGCDVPGPKRRYTHVQEIALTGYGLRWRNRLSIWLFRDYDCVVVCDFDAIHG